MAGTTITDKERLDYAWKNFSLIADQRIKTFNFYIIVLIAAFSATISALDKDLSRHLYCVIGLAHMYIAALFFVIDVRGVRILRICRSALDEIEESQAFRGHRKLSLTDKRKNRKGAGSLISYRSAFWATFAFQFAFGVVVAAKPNWIAIPHLAKEQSVLGRPLKP